MISGEERERICLNRLWGGDTTDVFPVNVVSNLSVIFLNVREVFGARFIIQALHYLVGRLVVLMQHIHVSNVSASCVVD